MHRAWCAHATTPRMQQRNGVASRWPLRQKHVDTALFLAQLASATRDSFLRAPGFVGNLSPRALRFGQSLCQCEPLHQRHDAHLLLHCSFGSGRGRFGSAGLLRAASPRTANACAESGLDSSSRRTLRASTSLSRLRAALIVSDRLPTPAQSKSFTSSNVEMLSLSRWTAFAIFSDSTVSGNWAEAVCSATPRTSCEWSIAAMVALVAEDATLASAARVRSSSLPLPLLARGCDDVALGFVVRERWQCGNDRRGNGCSSS
eukprot:4848678-Pleurochrysis_carterae.AAC.1